MRFARNVLVGVVCLGIGLAVNADERQRLPYGDLAKNALSRAGMAEIAPHAFSFEEFLHAGFLHVRLGIYDLYLPAGDELEAEELEHYRDMALTLLDAQRTWLEWLAPEVKGTREPLADLKKVQRWVSGWKIDRLPRAATAGQRELLEALKAKKDIGQSSSRLAEYMGSGAVLSLDREKPVFEPVVLVPDRERFVEMICIGGWLYPGHRTTYWNRHITHWTHFHVDRYKFLSLELTDPCRVDHDWTAGVPMNDRNPDAMAQQVTQLAFGSLLDNYYGARIPASIAGALSVNLVIDQFGECDTRADGDLRIRHTGAREVFVPGGNPNGGMLPPLGAASRWRDRQGADHFVSLLRQAQKQGASRIRKAKEKHLHFELISDSGAARRVVTAPFLGAGAADEDAVPPEYRGDWLEFQRAYRSCFLWWLQNKAERSVKSSGKSFATLLHDLAGEQNEEGDLAGAIARIYDGHGLSSEELGKKDLEGRFLRWLGKQR